MALHHIQKTDPKPPVIIAADTPIMFPTPSVPASDNDTALKVEILSLSLLSSYSFFGKKTLKNLTGCVMQKNRSENAK